MNAVPIVLLCGAAGSGKDTVGKIIADNFNGICLGQADPMKRFVGEVFGYSEEDLWGPSDLRNAETFWSKSGAEEVAANFDSLCTDWVKEVLPGLSKTKTAYAQSDLLGWFDDFVWPKLESGAGITPRYVLQTIGTEWGRNQSVDMWSDYATRAAGKLLTGGYDYNHLVGVRPDDVSCDFVVITDGRFKNEVLNVRLLGGAAIRIDRPTDPEAIEAAGVKNHASEKELGAIPRHFYSGLIDNTQSLVELRNRVNEMMADQFRPPKYMYPGPNGLGQREFSWK